MSRAIAVLLAVLIGTLAAYIGSTIWSLQLNADVIRTSAEAGPGDVCSGAIDQEYFAQLSQVIPLLLVALGLDAGFLRRRGDDMAWALALFTVGLLCVAEALALSTLPEPNVGCGDVLFAWHEYAAFIVTLEASFVALVALVWALVLGPPAPGDRAPASSAS
jgi:hypothetical protein